MDQKYQQPHIQGSWSQVPCKKSVSGANFTQGVQEFSHSLGSTQNRLESRSHFIAKVALTAGTGNAPVLRDGIALASHVCANLYSAVSMRMGQQEISSQKSYVPQAHALRRRVSQPAGRQQTIGRELDVGDESFGWRQNLTAADGVLSSDPPACVPITHDPASPATVAIAANGVVTGINTQFAAEGEYKVNPGDVLVVGPLNTEYQIQEVESDTKLNLATLPRAAVAATNVAHIKKASLSRRSNILWLKYVPEIGISELKEPLGAGQYSWFLTPNANFQKACVEAFRNTGNALAARNYQFEVLDVTYYPYIFNMSNVSENRMVKRYILKEIDIVSQSYVPNSVLQYTVPSSTYAVAVFVQGPEAGLDNRLPATSFKTLDGKFNQIENIQVTYSNVSKPTIDYTSSFVPGTSGLIQRYLDSYTECKLINSEGGAESLLDWQNSPFYFFSWDKDENDRSTNLQVRIKYADGMSQTNNVMVACFYKKVVQVTSEKGYITEVSSLVA